MMFLRGRYQKAKEIIRHKTEALAADAAADEQLALATHLNTCVKQFCISNARMTTTK